MNSNNRNGWFRSADTEHAEKSNKYRFYSVISVSEEFDAAVPDRPAASV
jgi:hypothetical protein